MFALGIVVRVVHTIKNIWRQRHNDTYISFAKRKEKKRKEKQELVT